jgi:hypothetical protein
MPRNACFLFFFPFGPFRAERGRQPPRLKGLDRKKEKQQRWWSPPFPAVKRAGLEKKGKRLSPSANCIWERQNRSPYHAVATSRSTALEPQPSFFLDRRANPDCPASHSHANWSQSGSCRAAWST